MANLVDLYLVYRILRLFTTPFAELEANKTGVIDDEGNIVVPSEKKEHQHKTIHSLSSTY